jgi:hypothetical protein
MIDALDRRLHDAEAALAAALTRVAVLEGVIQRALTFLSPHHDHAAHGCLSDALKGGAK